MDARDALRRYLEQRRELGETELVLDGLTVDEAMKLLGASSGASSPAGAPTMKSAGRRPGAPTSSGRPAAAAAPDEAGDPAAGDWRAALRAAERADRAPTIRETTPAESASAGLTSRPAPEPLTDAEIVQLPSLEAIAVAVQECTRCRLSATATQGVPGEGNPHAELVVVGEAPGANEDASGRPFVGQAGQLLTRILAAINLAREDVFICNVLKHRPPGNRNPQPDEIVACSPYLVRQLELVRPKVILALGTFAAQTLLASKQPISKLRGSIHQYHGIPLVVTYHPAALLRNPSWKRPTWEDVQLARRILDRAPGAA